MVAIVGALAIAIVASTEVQAADAFLSQLVGDWIGRGAMKQSPDAEQERLYCKISNTMSPDGLSLLQKGRCSLASNSGTIDGSITALGDNAYSGSLASLASRAPAVLNGALVETVVDKEKHEQLVLNAEYVDKVSGLPVKSVNTIELVDDGYSLTATKIDPRDGSIYTSSQIVFTAR
jgi:uncharacterized protein YnzC (UPF0291/DUF896 family)